MRNFLNKKFKNDGYYCISIALLAISFVVFLLVKLPVFSLWFRLKVVECVSLNPAVVINKKFLWVFFTYPLLEYDAWSLLLNSIFLLWCGTGLEKLLGSKEFSLFYFFCVVFSGLTGFLVSLSHPQFAILNTFGIYGFYAISFALLFMFAYFYRDSYVLFMFVIPLRPATITLLGILIQIVFLVAKYSPITFINLILSLSGIIFSAIYMKLRLRLRLLEFFKSMFMLR